MFHKDVSGDYVGRRVDVGCAQKHLASMSLMQGHAKTEKTNIAALHIDWLTQPEKLPEPRGPRCGSLCCVQPQLQCRVPSQVVFTTVRAHRHMGPLQISFCRTVQNGHDFQLSQSTCVEGVHGGDGNTNDGLPTRCARATPR